MTRPMDAPNPTPFQIALDVRSRLMKSITAGVDYDAIVSNKVAACLLRLPQEVLSSHFSSIMISSAGRLNQRIVAGSTMLVAQAAFDAWSNDIDPRLQLQFDIATYEALFGLIQIVRTAPKKQVIHHMKTTTTPLILESLALRKADLNWHSLAATVTRDGEFDADIYMTLLQNELTAAEERLKTSGLGKETLRKHPLQTIFDTAAA